MIKIYLTHDNGGRPFKVVVNKNNLSVYKRNNRFNDNSYSKKYIINLNNFSNIFIGKSIKNEMTEFSGSYGDNFDGNSILVNLKDNIYIYIGINIFRFHSLNEIYKYKSPLGNNDVSYPYAIDKSNNYYLMIEDAIINCKSNKIDDPYEYYYNLELMPKEINDSKIISFYIGDNKYNFSYKSRPHKDYDRISSWGDFSDGMKFILDDNKEYKIDRKEYIKIIKKIGKYNNIQHLKYFKLLDKGIW